MTSGVASVVVVITVGSEIGGETSGTSAAESVGEALFSDPEQPTTPSTAMSTNDAFTSGRRWRVGEIRVLFMNAPSVVVGMARSWARRSANRLHPWSAEVASIATIVNIDRRTGRRSTSKSCRSTLIGDLCAATAKPQTAPRYNQTTRRHTQPTLGVDGPNLRG